MPERKNEFADAGSFFYGCLQLTESRLRGDFFWLPSGSIILNSTRHPFLSNLDLITELSAGRI
jgi:hypothetical protein